MYTVLEDTCKHQFVEDSFNSLLENICRSDELMKDVGRAKTSHVWSTD